MRPADGSGWKRICMRGWLCWDRPLPFLCLVRTSAPLRSPRSCADVLSLLNSPTCLHTLGTAIFLPGYASRVHLCNSLTFPVCGLPRRADAVPGFGLLTFTLSQLTRSGPRGAANVPSAQGSGSEEGRGSQEEELFAYKRQTQFHGGSNVYFYCL